MAATYEPIATTTLSSTSATITFSSIAATYTDLVLIVSMMGSNVSGYTKLQFNSDAATNYSDTFIYSNGSAAGSLRDASGNQIYVNQTGTISSTIPLLLKINVFSYAGSTNKTVLMETANDKNGSGGVERTVGLWRSTAAITSINLGVYAGVFSIGTTATLYGIKAA